MNKHKSPLLTREQAAEYLGLSASTLAVWASTKRYDLTYIKIGSKVFYSIEALDDFITRSTVR